MFYLPLRNVRPTGGNRSKRNRLKSFMGKVANQLFSQKQEPSSNLLWGHVLKTCFFIFHLKQQKFILLSGQVWVLWEKKLEKQLFLPFFGFCWVFEQKNKKKDLKVKVFFKFLKAQNANCFCFVFYLWRYNKTIKDNLLIKWTMIPTSVFCFFRFLKPWHLCLLGKMVHPENNSKG